MMSKIYLNTDVLLINKYNLNLSTYLYALTIIIAFYSFGAFGFLNLYGLKSSFQILVVLFTYFYTAVTFDPKQISENVQRQGGFVPGIRPGRHTAEYLHKTLNRITLTGALFLGLVAVLPFIMRAILDIPSLIIGGTGILIVVSVVIETVKQIESQVVMRDYDKFY